jgi:predicted type IV restriction endonuclease
MTKFSADWGRISDDKYTVVLCEYQDGKRVMERLLGFLPTKESAKRAVRDLLIAFDYIKKG